jgi:hypothetical protein
MLEELHQSWQWMWMVQEQMVQLVPSWVQREAGK